MPEKLATAQHFRNASKKKSPEVLRHAVASVRHIGGETHQTFSDATGYFDHDITALANGDKKIAKVLGNQSRVQQGLKAVADYIGANEAQKQQASKPSYLRPPAEFAIA